MTWQQYHSQSEQLAIAAEAARRSGDVRRAEVLYREAAGAEQDAFGQLTPDKRRTRGITAVSAVALWYKGREYLLCERLAYRYLAEDSLPTFAVAQLRELLYSVWTTQGAENAGIRFVPGDVLVSIKGGQIVHGGAPLDLIVRKVEGIQAVLFRTVEMLLDRPFRRRGGPSADIQSMFRPWLFQAPAGSYQFAVRVQEPPQRDLWEEVRPQVDRVTTTFFDVLRATAGDPETQLSSVVHDSQYREAFLSLSRNLAPTGKTFESLEVRDASTPAEAVAFLSPETRKEINSVLRKLKPPRETVHADEAVTVQGVLRGVHLDQDWLEVVTSEPNVLPIRIDEAGEALDDVVGPMINRRVIVSAVRRGQRYLYRDIETEE